MIRTSLRALCLVLGLAPVAHAAQPPVLTEWFRTVPPPPASAAVAALWVQGGRVAAPEVVQLESTLVSARTASLAEASGATDAARDERNAAVQLAVDGYQSYRAASAGSNAPAAVLGGRVQWLAKRFSGLHRRVAGTDRVQEVREQELAAYRALFTDWQGQRAPIVAKAQAELAAAGDPAAIASGADRASVLRYRAAMIEEVEVLLGLTRYAVERAAGLPTAEPSTVTPSATTLWDLMSDDRAAPP